jgi:hypothetical protein
VSGGLISKGHPLGATGVANLYDGPPERQLEYIKAMMAVAIEDVRHVTLYVTLSLAAFTMFVTQVRLSGRYGFGYCFPGRPATAVAETGSAARTGLIRTQRSMDVPHSRRGLRRRLPH